MVLKMRILTVSILCLISSFVGNFKVHSQPSWVKYSYFQNWGGLNDNLSSTEISDNEASDIQNVVFDTGGALVKRYGYIAIPNSPKSKVVSGSSISITGLIFYQQNDEDRYIVGTAYADGAAKGFQKTYEIGGGIPNTGWTEITGSGIFPSTGYAVDNLADFAVAENVVVITLDSAVQVKPIKWTGAGNVSALTVDTDCPAVTLVEYHLNHLFLSGNDTYPSRVYFSAIDDITNYTSTDFFDVQTADGTRVRGLISAFNSLYIFKDYSIWRLSGTNRDDYILEKVVDGIGTLSSQSIMVVNNLMYFTTAQNDIAAYDGGYNIAFPSQKIRNTISELNFTRASNALGIAFSTYRNNDYDYYGSVSTVGSGTNNKILFFDTFHKAWSKFSGINVNAWCVGRNGVGKNILIFGDYSGYVYSYPSTSYYDGDEVSGAITSFYQTKWFKYPEICLGDKYWRLLKTYVLSENSNIYLNVNCMSDYEFEGKAVNISLGSSTTSLWDVMVWDEDVWGGQTMIINRSEINKGKNMFQIKYSNNNLSEGFTIFGFETFIEPTIRI